MAYFKQPKCPVKFTDLEPHISAETMGRHWEDNLAAYYHKLNDLIEGTHYQKMNLGEIIRDSKEGPIFDNASQIWNHLFFFHGLKKDIEPSQLVLAKIHTSFGSMDNFKSEFSKVAEKAFGSGWIWLLDRGGNLEITITENADTPLRRPLLMKTRIRPLLILDIWEHAFTYQYPAKRAEYVTAFLDHCINWAFVESNLNQ